MKILKTSFLALGLLSLSATTLADLPKAFDYNKASTNYVDNTSSGGSSTFDDVANKTYFGGSIGPSEADSYCTGATGCEDNDTAWKVFGGYKITERLSAEAAYVNLGDIHKTSGGTVQNSDVSAFTASAIGSMPINDQIDIFGKVGAMRWSSDNTAGSESGFGMTYGVGAKMNISERTKLRAEWEKLPDIETAPGEETDVNMLSVGVELSTY
jgi:OOP family OmpA-OmpF porin